MHAACEFDSAVCDAEEEQSLIVTMPFENGAGDPLNRGADFRRADRLKFGHEASLWRPVSGR